MKFNLKTKRDEKSNLQAAAEEDEEHEVSVSASSQSVSQSKPGISGLSEVLQNTGGLRSDWRPDWSFFFFFIWVPEKTHYRVNKHHRYDV